RTMIHIKSSTYNIDATPAVYTLSLHDALPISSPHPRQVPQETSWRGTQKRPRRGGGGARERRSANQGRGEEVGDGPGCLGDVGLGVLPGEAHDAALVADDAVATARLAVDHQAPAGAGANLDASGGRHVLHAEDLNVGDAGGEAGGLGGHRGFLPLRFRCWHYCNPLGTGVSSLILYQLSCRPRSAGRSAPAAARWPPR